MSASRYMRLLAVAVFLLMALSPVMTAEGQSVEQEPNSDMARAQEVQSGEFVTGALDPSADSEDWFKIWVPKGMVLNATVHMDDLDLNADLEVHFKYVAGKLSDYAWSRTDYEYETVCIISVDEQYYYMRVYVRSGTGSYTFDAYVNDAPVLSPQSPNAVGTLYNDSYNVIDFYKVWLEHRGDTTDQLEVGMTKAPIPTVDRAWINLRIGALYKWSVGLRWYDISWGNETYEHARAVASETGWYYIRVNAFNGSGDYDLGIEITSVPTDGNDGGGDAQLLYGPGLEAEGWVHQARDHRDCYVVQITQGESLEAELDLGDSVSENPTIFAITILEPDGEPIGEWTNYRESWLDHMVTARMDVAYKEGKYILMVEAKVAVNVTDIKDLDDRDGYGSYSLKITPSGHNTRPKAAEAPVSLSLEEDVPAQLDLTSYFTDDNMVDGDMLSYDFVSASPFDGTEDALEVEVEGGIATITPKGDWSGSGTMEFVAWDLFWAQARLTVFFTVDEVNDAPEALERYMNFSLKENEEATPVDLDDVFSDPDLRYGDLLFYSVEGNDTLPAWVDSRGFLNIGPMLGLGQPAEDLIVRATDVAGESDLIFILVNVGREQHQPTVDPNAPKVISIDEDGTGTIDLYEVFSDLDPEDSRLSFQWGEPEHVPCLRDDEGILTLTPVKDWSGTEYITITAKDHSGLMASIKIAIKVWSSPDPPVIEEADPVMGSQVDIDGESFSAFIVRIGDEDLPDDHLTYNWYLDGRLLPHYSHILTLDETDENMLPNGTHTLDLKVRDEHGHTAECHWTLEVKRPAPPTVIRGPTPKETTMTGGFAFAAWLMIFTVFTEPGRYSIFKYIWVPLYTKIRKEEVLDQFVRGRIYGYIEHNPGVNYTQIKKKMNVGNGTLTHHLSMLERQNYIKAERDGIYKRFYPKDFSIDEDAVELSKVQKDIFFLAKTQPGISQKAIASKIGVSKRVVSYHVRLMLDARLIEVKRKGRKNALFAIER